MADQNPFSSLAQGIEQGQQMARNAQNDARQYAMDQASLDFKKQEADRQMQEFEQRKKEFNTKLGSQYWNQLNGISLMAPGKRKSDAIKRLTKEAQESGINLNPDVVSTLDDPNYQAQFSKLFEVATQTKMQHPEVFNDLISNLIPALGQQDAVATLFKSADQLNDFNKAKASAIATANKEQNKEDRQNDRQDTQAHRDNVNIIKKDPETLKRLTQFKNLDNALSIITNADNLTPQQIHEFQQAVRRNLGIQGTSGVDERASTYIDSLGLQAENFKQFLTGEPAEIAKDSKLIEHLKNLAGIEQDQIKSQYQDRLSTLTAGHESMYERRPDLKADLDKLVAAAQKQFTPRADKPKEESKDSPLPVKKAQSDQKKTDDVISQMRNLYQKTEPGPKRAAFLQKLHSSQKLTPEQIAQVTK